MEHFLTCYASECIGRSPEIVLHDRIIVSSGLGVLYRFLLRAEISIPRRHQITISVIYPKGPSVHSVQL